MTVNVSFAVAESITQIKDDAERITPRLKAMILREFANGIDSMDTAKMYGVHEATVYNVLIGRPRKRTAS